MYTKSATIVNEVGLHARPASVFVMKAKEFTSAITINKKGASDKYNAKSLMKLLILAAAQGDVVEITAEGADERQAVDALIGLISSGLGE